MNMKEMESLDCLIQHVIRRIREVSGNDVDYTTVSGYVNNSGVKGQPIYSGYMIVTKLKSGISRERAQVVWSNLFEAIPELRYKTSVTDRGRRIETCFCCGISGYVK